MAWYGAAVAGAFFSCPDSEKPLNSKKVIINTDGASKGNPGPAAIGVAIKDERGQLITSVSRGIGRATNNEAEYQAIIAALEQALKIGASHITIHSDSELVVRQLNGQYRVKKATLQALYQQVKQLQGRFTACNFTHINRQQNMAADKLANEALT